jgi:isoleucyl-tRNA synthetase
VNIHVEGESIVLTPEDVAVERKVREGLVAATVQEITVALDTALTEELLLEGLARELVNKLNSMRREGGFAVTDRIAIEMQTSERVKHALELHREYIMHEVLGTQVIFECPEGTEWDLNGEPCKIAIALSVVG